MPAMVVNGKKKEAARQAAKPAPKKKASIKPKIYKKKEK
jgi:hypothetical protein